MLIDGPHGAITRRETCDARGDGVDTNRKRVRDLVIAGGVESISLVQTGEMRLGPDPELLSMHNGVYMPMIDTAEIVGNRYGISRERCDVSRIPLARSVASRFTVTFVLFHP